MAASLEISGNTRTLGWTVPKEVVPEAVLNAHVPVQVEEFGAIGNGIKDDSLAFTDAIASGQPLLLRAGAEYLVSDVDAGGKALRFWGYAKGCEATIRNIGAGVAFTNVGEYIDWKHVIFDASSSPEFAVQAKGATPLSEMCVEDSFFMNTQRAFIDADVAGDVRIVRNEFTGMADRPPLGSLAATYAMRIVQTGFEQLVRIDDNRFIGVETPLHTNFTGGSQGTSAPAGVALFGTDVVPNQRRLIASHNYAYGMGQGLDTPLPVIGTYAHMGGGALTEGNVGRNMHGPFIRIDNTSWQSYGDDAEADGKIGLSLFGNGITTTSTHFGGDQNIQMTNIEGMRAVRTGLPTNEVLNEPCLQFDGDVGANSTINQVYITDSNLIGGGRSLAVFAGVRRLDMTGGVLSGVHRAYRWEGLNAFPSTNSVLCMRGVEIRSIADDKPVTEYATNTNGRTIWDGVIVDLLPTNLNTPVRFEGSHYRIMNSYFEGGAAGMATLIALTGGRAAFGDNEYNGASGTVNVALGGATLMNQHDNINFGVFV